MHIPVLEPAGRDEPNGSRMRPVASLAPSDIDTVGERPVGGPVTSGWREGTLTRAKELESLCAWVLVNHPRENGDVLAQAVAGHLTAARQAAEAAPLAPPKHWRLFRRSGPLIERAMSNLDAAEAQIVNFASADYVLDLMPSVLANVQCHLIPSDPRRRELERIAQIVGVKDPDHPLLPDTKDNQPGHKLGQKLQIIEEERGRIATAMRAASSAALREQVRVRSFRNVVVVTTLVMTVLAIVVAIAGWIRPTLIPLCFAPEESGKAMVVCPTAQSASFSTQVQQSGTVARDIDDEIRDTTTPQDLLVVELVGLIAAAVAAAAAIRGIRGSSERHGVPVALAVLKLPTGAITAFLGLLLMRGQFVPGLSALDTSAQILAWALVFGYAQQLFTRLVDRQGHVVLDSVRGADKAQPTPSPP